jgi:hypothetical protein
MIRSVFVVPLSSFIHTTFSTRPGFDSLSPGRDFLFLSDFIFSDDLLLVSELEPVSKEDTSPDQDDG